MKTILVPTDFSPNANKALSYAAELSNLSGAGIVIVHVTDLTNASMALSVNLRGSFDKDIIDDANRKLDALVSSTREITNAKVEHQLYNGAVVDAILQAAKENNADLIVMGTLGDAAFTEKLFGSITAKLIGEASIPVLAVPLLYEWGMPENILLAINNFEDPVEIMNPVINLSSLLNVPLHVSVFTDEDLANAREYLDNKTAIEMLTNKLQQMQPALTIEARPITGPYFEEAIKNHIHESGTGLLVMLTHKRNFIESIFNRSITKKMSYHTDIPLLSIPVN